MAAPKKQKPKGKRKSGGKLTSKQRAFVEQYLIDRNATAAYKRAGYVDSDAAHANSARLIANDSIKRAIAKGEAEISERTKVTVERIEAELALIAVSDMVKFADWTSTGVQFTPRDALEADATRCILEVSETVNESGSNLSIKLHSKLDALKQLAKRHGFYQKPTAGKRHQGLSRETADMIRRRILGINKKT